MGLDARQKDAEKQRLPIVARMRRDADALRVGGEPRRVVAELDPGVAAKGCGDGEALERPPRVSALPAPAQRRGAGRLLHLAEQRLAFLHQIEVAGAGTVP